MIPLLVIGGITAAVALFAKNASSTHPASATAPSMPQIGSGVTPTPSTPTPATHEIAPLFPTPETESLYQAAVAAREASGIPIVAEPQPAPARLAAAYVFPGSTPPRIAPAPAPSRAPIAQVGAGGQRFPSRLKLSLF